MKTNQNEKRSIAERLILHSQTTALNGDSMQERIFAGKTKYWQKINGIIQAQFAGQKTLGIDVGAADGILATISNPEETTLVSYDPWPQPKDKTLPFVGGTAESLPFASNSFSYATVLYALHHFEDKEQALSEVARIVQPGGLIFIIEEFLRYPGQHRFAEINDKVVNYLLFGENSGEFGGQAQYFKSPEQIEGIAHQLGLKTLYNEKFPEKPSLRNLHRTKKSSFGFQKA